MLPTKLDPAVGTASSSSVALIRDAAAPLPAATPASASASLPIATPASASASLPIATPASASASLPIAAPASASASLPSAAPTFTDWPPPSAVPTAPGVPAPVAYALSQPLVPATSRRLLLLAVAAVILTLAIATAALLAADPVELEAKLDPVQVGAHAVSSCDQLEALGGAWVFTTTTTGARRKERLGVRGFYRLEIEVEGCSARASMAKTGRTDRTAFDDHKIPRAEATLVQGTGTEAYGWTGAFVLRNEDGQGIDTQFALTLDGERLVGSWRQLGERWTSSGLYGVLEGQREGDPTTIRPDRSNQPCTVRCATPDDITLIDAPDEAAHAACLASCE
jgi:hypothetical protein